MAKEKRVLLIDDEQGFLEALVDALAYVGVSTETARTGEEGLEKLSQSIFDLVTVDIMMPPGPSLENVVGSQQTGVYLCEEIRRRYPQLPVFCISVVNDRDTLHRIKSLNIRFIKKGETPLRTVLDLMRSRLTGVAYSTDPDDTQF